MRNRFRTLTLAILPPILFFLTVSFLAAGETPPTLQERVAQLVEDLNSPTQTVRVQAHEALLELGPQALPHLPPPELLPNAFVRERVRRVRQLLEEEKARASVLASTVTFAGKHSLQVLLTEMADQTGNNFDSSSVSPQTLTQFADIH